MKRRSFLKLPGQAAAAAIVAPAVPLASGGEFWAAPAGPLTVEFKEGVWKYFVLPEPPSFAEASLRVFRGGVEIGRNEFPMPDLNILGPGDVVKIALSANDSEIDEFAIWPGHA